jgi:hypothetical protein
VGSEAGLHISPECDDRLLGHPVDTQRRAPRFDTSFNEFEIGPRQSETSPTSLDPRKLPTFALYFRRYVPFGTFGFSIVPLALAPGRFEGDKRTAASASTDPTVTARTEGTVWFNQFGIVNYLADSSGSTFHPAIGRDLIDIADVSIKVNRGKLAGPGLFDFTASTAGSVPLTPKTVTPDINTIIKARVDFGLPNHIRLDGEAFGDNFPNLEVFLICVRSRHTAVLIDGRTTGGRDTGPYKRLWGTHSSHSLGRFSVTFALNEKGELTSNYRTDPTTLPEY